MVTSEHTVELLRGTRAKALLEDSFFAVEWEQLADSCPWSTVFQKKVFAGLWYDYYASLFEPLFLLGKRADTLTGLMLLSVSLEDGHLEFVGGHQSEYKVWIARPGENPEFTDLAFRKLKNAFPSAKLEAYYYPPTAPIDWAESPQCRKHVVLREVPWGRVRLDQFSMEQSPAYRKYLKELRRLDKLNVELQKWNDPAQYDAELERVIEICDFRAAALHGSRPFADHPPKAGFYRQLCATPGLLHATVLRIAGRIVSIEMNYIDRSSVLNGLFAHDPAYSRYCVGRYHLLRLCQYLSSEGFEWVDLTPDGEYKDDFATETGSAHVLHFYSNALAAEKHRRRLQLGRWIKRRFPNLKPRLSRARAQASRLSRARWTRIVPVLATRAAERVMGQREIRVYSLPRLSAPAALAPTPFTITANRLLDLCLYEPSSASSPDRQAFLRDALRRVEDGSHIYTIVEDGKLLHYGWISVKPVMRYPEVGWPKQPIPKGSAVLSDFYTHPHYRGRGYYQATLRRMLNDLADRPYQQIFIGVLANNGPSRHSIEKVGFQYVGSVFQQFRWFRSRSWSTLPAAWT